MLKVGEIKENGEIVRDYYREGFIFKDDEAFKNKKGTCYVAELSDNKYTYDDILAIANNNEFIANELYATVDWQHPSTLYDEWINYGEIIECEACGKSYLTDGDENAKCPYCKAKN